MLSDEQQADQLMLDNSCLCNDDLCIGCAVVAELVGDLRASLAALRERERVLTGALRKSIAVMADEYEGFVTGAMFSNDWREVLAEARAALATPESQP